MPHRVPTAADRRKAAAQGVEATRRFRWLRALIRDERRRQRMIFVLSLAGLALVGLLAALSYFLQPLPLDLFVTHGLQAFHARLFWRLMVAISRVGEMPASGITVGVGALLVGALFGWQDGAYLLLLTAFQGVANLLIKAAIGRPRPLDSLVDVFVPVRGNSFPSGHVMFYTVFFGFLCFLAWVRLPRSLARHAAIIVTGAMVLLVGPSRIYLGAHWLSDVVAAHLLGFIMLAFGVEIYLRFLAPAMPAQQDGLVGAQDAATIARQPE